MFVSVAMCTYDGREYVAEQLESILSGTRRPDEIVVVDDGSRDDTVDIVRTILAGDGIAHRVEVNRPGLGVTANFERATSLCRGDVIVLSDQDDRWHPDRLAAAVDAFQSDDDLVLIHGDARIVDADLRDSGETLFGALGADCGDLDAIDAGHGFDVLLRRNLATGATMSFRARLLDIARPFPADWIHDEWLAILAAAEGRVHVERRALIDYRQHGANQIGVRRLGFVGNVRRVLEAEPGRNAALARRARSLVDRLSSAGADLPRIEAARGKAAFEGRRAAFQAARILRAPQVAREVLRGDYVRFASRGRLDILRDLLQRR